MKITRREGLKGLATAAAAIGMPAVVHAEESEIVIGAPNSLTGGLGEVGTRYAWGVQIAVNQINKDGGIKSLNGAKLKLVIADTSSENPTQAASVTRRMIDQDGAVVILGAGASAMTLAAQVETEKSEIPLITGSYADGIVNRGYKYTFKLSPQGGAVWNWSMTSGYEMWKDAKGSPPKSALIFMSNDAVGLVVQKQLPEHAKTLNLDVPFSQSFQMGLSDPSVAVAPILRYKPDLIFLGGFTNDIILIIKALRGVGVTAPIFGAGPAGTDSVGRGLGASRRQVLRPADVELGPHDPGQQGTGSSVQGRLPVRALSAGERATRRRLCSRADLATGAGKSRIARPEEDPRRPGRDGVRQASVPGRQGQIRRQRLEHPQPRDPGRVDQTGTADRVAEGEPGRTAAVVRCRRHRRKVILDLILRSIRA